MGREATFDDGVYLFVPERGGHMYNVLTLLPFLGTVEAMGPSCRDCVVGFVSVRVSVLVELMSIVEFLGPQRKIV